ncbi:AP2/ERF family transcription factor, partial [Singulisphaera rosea]
MSSAESYPSHQLEIVTNLYRADPKANATVLAHRYSEATFEDMTPERMAKLLAAVVVAEMQRASRAKVDARQNPPKPKPPTPPPVRATPPAPPAPKVPTVVPEFPPILDETNHGFRGITRNKGESPKPWRCQLCHGGKTITGGRYATAIEAARGYDALVIAHGADRSKLNFPDEASPTQESTMSIKAPIPPAPIQRPVPEAAKPTPVGESPIAQELR